jgi:hypothetical protein
LGAWGLEIRPEHPAQGSTIGFAPIAKVVGDKRLMRDGEREANARLIAAAPELLEACKLALNAFERNDAIDWSVLSDAISKATGVEP